MHHTSIPGVLPSALSVSQLFADSKPKESRWTSLLSASHQKKMKVSSIFPNWLLTKRQNGIHKADGNDCSPCLSVRTTTVKRATLQRGLHAVPYTVIRLAPCKCVCLTCRSYSWGCTRDCCSGRIFFCSNSAIVRMECCAYCFEILFRVNIYAAPSACPWQRVGKVSGELGQACLISPTLRRVGEIKHKIACRFHKLTCRAHSSAPSLRLAITPSLTLDVRTVAQAPW